ncbi:hypothetical protein AB833_13525 [Chromatiales bacterium (ex Bugula neritina AB1)]|nr:hypothetical protein AB833_13525 [Chromatiales bacterium (ex Bugula neritina AB1)]
MNMLVAGLTIFVLIHLIPSFPAFRGNLIARVGDGIYKGLFSLLSIISIVLLVYGLKNVEVSFFYQPVSGSRTVTFALMFVAIYLFLSNSSGPAPSSAKYWTAHPLNWGVVCWSVGHLLSNGEKAQVLLFGSFLVFSLISIFTGNLRGQKPALAKRPSIAAEGLFLLVVLAVYVGLFLGHRYITGMALA